MYHGLSRTEHCVSRPIKIGENKQTVSGIKLRCKINQDVYKNFVEEVRIFVNKNPCSSDTCQVTGLCYNCRLRY